MTKIYSFVCSCCGATHEGSPSYAFNAPAPYLEQPENIQKAGKLGTDLCTYEDEDGAHYFIRTLLEIPIHDIEEPFTWGVWVSVSEKSFYHYIETYDTPNLDYGYFGYLCNYLPWYETTYGLALDIQVQLDGCRPKIILHDAAHQLVQDFAHGISPTLAQEIAEYCSHKSNTHNTIQARSNA